MKKPLGIILPIILLIVWEVAAIAINNPFILPRLETVIPVLLHPTEDILGTGSLLHNAAVSLERVGLGFLVAVAIAVPLGVGMGWSARLDAFMDTTVQLLRPIPPLAWGPLAIAWFSVGLSSMVFIIFLGGFFPILLNTIDGVRSVKKTWVEVAETLGASERQVLGKVVMPGAAPTIWTGFRVGFGVAWMCVVAAEWLPGTTSGLGYLTLYAYNFGQMQFIIAGMITIGIIGIAFDLLFRSVEDRWFAWRRLER
ncbi:MAG TPA: ABC transporter permease [Methanomicrobiales archaeon]|nr:ABC transporter permease [Methanomicrobiales archaeon]